MPLKSRICKPRTPVQDASRNPAPSAGKGLTRRQALAAAAGTLGASLLGARADNAFAQAKGPLTIRLWSNDQVQQREWYQSRVKLFMEKNRNIKVDYQWFPFGELGKKVSVGFATGTAPEGFVSYDWFMPLWLDKDLLAPLDVQQLGYPSLDAFSSDFSAAAIAGAVKDGKVYGFPTWFYGYLNYLNTRHFKEAGLDPVKDAPDTWEQFGEVARRLTRKTGGAITRQGAKFAMHAAQWTMIQFNPILLQCSGQWFDANGKCTVNSEAGVKAMTIRAALVRQYGAEDPADTVATNPLPQMDWLKERSSMFLSHPVPPGAIKSQNPQMAADQSYRVVQCPGVEPGKGYSTAYGFNLVVNKQASKEKQEQEALHELFKFVMGDLVACWNHTGPFTVARKSGWADDPAVKNFPDLHEIIKCKDQGVFLPRTLVYNELADAMHRAVQKIMLNKAEIKPTLDEAAAEVDRATAAYKRG
ncbi:MAG: extracellular solute-binding protein [Hyphomicrobiales bacterium]|nr:extracellular solute-binding protein [Hyphomicrobiales bacterium]